MTRHGKMAVTDMKNCDRRIALEWSAEKKILVDLNKFTHLKPTLNIDADIGSIHLGTSSVNRT